MSDDQFQLRTGWRPTRRAPKPRWIITQDFVPLDDGEMIETLVGTRSSNMPDPPGEWRKPEGWLEFRISSNGTPIATGWMERLSFEPVWVFRSGTDFQLEIWDQASGLWCLSGINVRGTHPTRDS
ncbi:MAG: hypothetical protein SGI90_09530 [Candidatus Eisenbacteria bacterium]|nr:hypothetical protein [Candidatus Eisenbacteria bacterium]